MNPSCWNKGRKGCKEERALPYSRRPKPKEGFLMKYTSEKKLRAERQGLEAGCYAYPEGCGTARQRKHFSVDVKFWTAQYLKKGEERTQAQRATPRLFVRGEACPHRADPQGNISIGRSFGGRTGQDWGPEAPYPPGHGRDRLSKKRSALVERKEKRSRRKELRSSGCSSKAKGTGAKLGSGPSSPGPSSGSPRTSTPRKDAWSY